MQQDEFIGPCIERQFESMQQSQLQALLPEFSSGAQCLANAFDTEGRFDDWKTQFNLNEAGDLALFYKNNLFIDNTTNVTFGLVAATDLFPYLSTIHNQEGQLSVKHTGKSSYSVKVVVSDSKSVSLPVSLSSPRLSTYGVNKPGSRNCVLTQAPILFFGLDCSKGEVIKSLNKHPIKELDFIRLLKQLPMHLNAYAAVDGKLAIVTSDHIIPQSMGGSNKPMNRQAMLGYLNWRKGSNPTKSDLKIAMDRGLLTNKWHSNDTIKRFMTSIG